MAPVSSVSFEILTLSKFCSILVFPSTRLALSSCCGRFLRQIRNTDFACKSAVGERSFVEGRVSYGKFLCNHLFTALAVVQQYGGVDAPRRQVASFMLFSPSMLICTFTVLVSSVGVKCSEHSMLSVTSNPSMTQVASFSGEVTLTSLAERFSICLA